MNRHKTLLGVFCLAISVFVISGCYKDRTVIINKTTEVTKTVSYATDIAPIFSKSCAVSGCHASGGHVPDLSADKAYSSLLNGDYINTATPASSNLYLWMTGKKSTVMPIGGANDEYNALVLAWIKQGALNN